MKNYLLIPVSILLSSIAYTQTREVYVPVDRTRHEAFPVPYNGVEVFYSPKNFFSRVQITAVRDSGIQNEIKFLFVTTSKNMTAMLFDSITLEASSGGNLLINKPVRDTIWSQPNGSMALTRTLYLDLAGVEFVKKEKIKRITLLVNHEAVAISISNKSRKKLGKLANEIW